MLTAEEKKLLQQMADEGKSKEEGIAALSDMRGGVVATQEEKDRPIVNRFTEAVGLGGVVDVFGTGLARSGFGPQTGAEARQSIPQKTKAQRLGAGAQLGSIGAGAGVPAAGGLLTQMAVGAGLGYIYDVGSDLTEEASLTETLTPGAETIAGAAIPPVFRGVGAAFRGVGNLAQRGANALPTQGIRQRISEFAGRFPRAIRRTEEFIDEGTEIAKRKESSTPQVVKALDEGISLDTVDFVNDFDDPTRKAALEMLDLADGGRGAALPQTVPGKVAGDQFDLIETQRKNIGTQIGEFSDALPTQQMDILPTLRNLRMVLDQNGIRPFSDGIRFENVALTPKQQKLVGEMYDLATQNTQLSPRQIHQMDQLFSKLQREARFEGIDDVFIKVPTAQGTQDVNIYKVFRDVFSQQLDEIAEQAGRGDIRELNREYRTLRNLQDNLESTIVRQSRLEGVNVDPSESASVALRRLFSNAQSRAEYQAVYDQLDATSRALGFEGPRADTLMDFYLTDVKPLYPETVPKTSFEGGIRGAVSGIVDKITDVGAPNPKDQQKALRELLKLN